MKVNVDYSSNITNLAQRKFKLHSVKKEWRTAIITLLVAKIATNIVSMYAGYQFAYNYAYSYFANAVTSIIIAIIALLIIEVLTVVFTEKSAKFLLHGKFKTAIFPLLVAVAIFIISFHISTNGLALKSSQKVDHTESIVDNFAKKEQFINQKYDDQIADLKAAIVRIESNPAGWRNGKPTRLTDKQLKQIDTYNDKISNKQDAQQDELNKLTDNKEKSLFTNNANMEAEGNKYYQIVAFIMFFQLFANSLLMFYWSRIYQDEKKDEYMKDVAEDMAKGLNEKINSTIAAVYNKNVEIFETAFAFTTQEQQVMLPAAKKQEQTPGQEEKNQPFYGGDKQERQIGFFSQKQKQEQEVTAANNKAKKEVLGKLRENDALRTMLIKKYERKQIRLTQPQISKRANVKRWKYYNYIDMLVASGFISEKNNPNNKTK